MRHLYVDTLRITSMWILYASPLHLHHVHSILSHIPLKMLHPRNEPNPKTQIPRYKLKPTKMNRYRDRKRASSKYLYIHICTGTHTFSHTHTHAQIYTNIFTGPVANTLVVYVSAYTYVFTCMCIHA